MNINTYKFIWYNKLSLFVFLLVYFPIAVTANPLTFAVVSQVYGQEVYSGFGDFIFGIKSIEKLQTQYPNSEISFIIYTSYDQENKKSNKKYEVFRNMSKIKDVKVVLVNTRESHISEYKDAIETAETLLDSADIIIHTPAYLCELVVHNMQKYKSKLIYFKEYNTSYGIPNAVLDEFMTTKGTEEMVTLGTGLVKKGVPSQEKRTHGCFLITKELPCTQFDSEFLKTNITIPTEKEHSKDTFYFTHARSTAYLPSIILFWHFVESSSTENINIVTPVSDECMNIAPNIFTLSMKSEAVPIRKIIFIREGYPDDIVISNNTLDDDVFGRTITVMSPKSYSQNDNLRLNKYAKGIVSTGDHSMTDALAMKRLPIPSLAFKAVNARALYGDIEEFLNPDGEKDKSSNMLDLFSSLSGGISTITNALRALARGYEMVEEMMELKKQIHNYAQFGSEKWLQCEKSYIEYVFSDRRNFLEDTLFQHIDEKIKKLPAKKDCK
ncbi:MAG: hypothetical protein QS721_08505 [Candidatus Endonucleobacter sp. (ex Gigantidas childressi)]|nr:hypothetical protein [Candidatus Endonucleobacter sp. (ex Gigantidas childressi)]